MASCMARLIKLVKVSSSYIFFPGGIRLTGLARVCVSVCMYVRTVRMVCMRVYVNAK